MIYLSDEHIDRIGISWQDVISVIGNAVDMVSRKDYRQPVKPYLRYRNMVNRIIAMPAFLGGEVNAAGIKWIASFPGNIQQGLARAHAVTILNEADTGIPFCIINTNKISAIRTAGVTGLIIKSFLESRSALQAPLEIGITGFGPIGRMHLDLLRQMWWDDIAKVRLFDIRPVDISGLPEDVLEKVEIVHSWEDAYVPADIFITCTVSSAPYINLPPKKGSLQANVSLRDYQPQMRAYMDRIIVDDWEEICREKTDIEVMHHENGLNPEDTFSFTTHALDELFAGTGTDDVIMFNPMGMAVFDIATGWWYYREAEEKAIKVEL
ncbi:hypothetical protein [Chitinophaga filiformis]|uniref:Ornithine cyclodeaminase n=1 Tax=Chitinophaga filiformis TaxID=104663 RepID=A0A1G8B8G8_CHIFI|nr:hypothetical protein [Chitinophaga filiformis]SDH29303.1 ornithine cyclodeaminase [Chitinophaga filiformis]